MRTVKRILSPAVSIVVVFVTLPGFSETIVGRNEAQTLAPVSEPRMINASDDPLLAPFRFRSIGPASMGGRIDDNAVSESDRNIIYAGDKKLSKPLTLLEDVWMREER